jgi:hypothetical protein
MAKTVETARRLGNEPFDTGSARALARIEHRRGFAGGAPALPATSCAFYFKLAHYLLRTVLKELLLNFRMKQDGNVA